MRGDFYEYAGVFLWFFSMLLRRCTRNVTKFIPSGSISGIDMNWYGLSIDGTVVQNQYPGIMGQITIIDIPSTTITNNTQEMRKLWVRCKIDGFLYSPNIFKAVNIQGCWSALKGNSLNDTRSVEKYIHFLEENLCLNGDTFIFEKCFTFGRKKVHCIKAQSFGASFAGKVIAL